MYSLLIYSQTWDKDSTDLVDYKSNQLITDFITINTPGQIKRSSNMLYYIPDGQKSNKTSSDYLIDIAYQNNDYHLKKTTSFLSFEEELQSSDLPWLMFKGAEFPKKNRKYNLSQGDVIKIGKVKLRVKTIHTGKKNLEGKKRKLMASKSQSKQKAKKKTSHSLFLLPALNINNNSSMTRIIDQPRKAKKICKICYSCEEDSISNPLIRPCICSGSMKYIHYKCLKQWLESKIKQSHLSTPLCSVYSVAESKCELCKVSFPDYVNHRGVLYEILDLKTEANNYMVLQSAFSGKKNNKYLYYLNYDSVNMLAFGRGQEADVIIGDISVSRFHCQIIREGNICCLEDRNSKFGTGILIQNPMLRIIQEKPLNIQINHTFLQLSVKVPFSLFACCGEPRADINIDYQRLNIYNLNRHGSEVIKEESIDTSNRDDNNYEDKERDNSNSKHACIKDRSKKILLCKERPHKSLLQIIDSLNQNNQSAINRSNILQRMSSANISAILKKNSFKENSSKSRNVKVKRIKIISSASSSTHFIDKRQEGKNNNNRYLRNSMSVPSIVNISNPNNVISIENNSISKIDKDNNLK